MPLEDFIVKTGQVRQINFRIDKDLAEFLDDRCSSLQCKQSHYLRALIMQDRDARGSK